MIEKQDNAEGKPTMNEEDEVDASGMPTERAVEAMAMGVACAYGFYCEARAAGDASKTAYRADKVREEVGGLLQAIGKALGDLPGGRVVDGPIPRTRMQSPRRQGTPSERRDV